MSRANPKTDYYVIRKEIDEQTYYLKIDGWDVGNIPTKCEPEKTLISWGPKHMRAEWHLGYPDQVTVRRNDVGNEATDIAGWIVGLDVAYLLIETYGGHLYYIDANGKEVSCKKPKHNAAKDALCKELDYLIHLFEEQARANRHEAENNATPKGGWPANYVAAGEHQQKAKLYEAVASTIRMRKENGFGQLTTEKPVVCNSDYADVAENDDCQDYCKQINVKLTEEDMRHINDINRDFFDKEITTSTLGRILLRKGIKLFRNSK